MKKTISQFPRSGIFHSGENANFPVETVGIVCPLLRMLIRCSVEKFSCIIFVSVLFHIFSFFSYWKSIPLLSKEMKSAMSKRTGS